ncbi:hypothetical protein HID58_077402, partial [Brassica napus]
AFFQNLIFFQASLAPPRLLFSDLGLSGDCLIFPEKYEVRGLMRFGGVTTFCFQLCFRELASVRASSARSEIGNLLTVRCNRLVRGRRFSQTLWSLLGGQMSSWERVYPSVILSSQNMVPIRALLWCFETFPLYL